MNLKTLKGVKIIFAAIIILVVFVGSALVAYPLYQQQAKFKVDEKAAVSAEQQASANFSKMKKYSEQVPEVKKINDEASKSFPLPQNISSYMSYYKKLAKDSGLNGEVNVTTTLPTLVTGSGASTNGTTTPPAATGGTEGATPVPGGESTGTGDLASMNVDITVPASPEQAKAFSQKLLNGERSFTIQSMTIGSTTEGTSDNLLSIKGTTYFHRTIVPPVPVEAESAPVAPVID